MKKKKPFRKPRKAAGRAKPSAHPKPAKHPKYAKAAKRPHASGKRSEVEEAVPAQELDAILKDVGTRAGVGEDGRKPHWNHWTQVQCPYCGENCDVHFDAVEDGDVVHQDCAVCCKTIALNVSVEEDDIQVTACRA